MTDAMARTVRSVVPPLVRLLVLAVLTGCAADGNAGADLSHAASAMVGDAGAAVPPSGGFGWLGGYVRIAEDAPLDRTEVDALVRSAIEKALTRRGYRLVPSGEAERLIGYVLAIDSAVDDATLAGEYGIQPGLARSSGTAYEQGTLIIDVVRRGSRRSVWRGAIQADVVPGISESTRRRRIEAAAERLLSALPGLR
jgi:hypothetical protein